MQANHAEPGQTPSSAASDLVLHCLPMFQEKDAKHIWANEIL